jgi:hypothetical protein
MNRLCLSVRTTAPFADVRQAPLAPAGGTRRGARPDASRSVGDVQATSRERRQRDAPRPNGAGGDRGAWPTPLWGALTQRSLPAREPGPAGRKQATTQRASAGQLTEPRANPSTRGPLWRDRTGENGRSHIALRSHTLGALMRGRPPCRGFVSVAETMRARQLRAPHASFWQEEPAVPCGGLNPSGSHARRNRRPGPRGGNVRTSVREIGGLSPGVSRSCEPESARGGGGHGGGDRFRLPRMGGRRVAG